MSAAPIRLQFELSREELFAAYERDRTRFTMKRYWILRLSSFVWLWAIYYGWDYQPWWLDALLLLIAVHSWTFPQRLYWAGRLMMHSERFRTRPFAIVIETDERGLRVRHPEQKSGSRYWWSRLTGIDETEFGLELRFDGRDWGEVMIPWKAFQDEQHRNEFLGQICEHAPQVSLVAA